MGIAITKTVTCSPTASLSTKTTTNGPVLSDTCIVTPDPLVISNETTATDNDMTHSYSHLVVMVLLGAIYRARSYCNSCVYTCAVEYNRLIV